MNLTKIALKRPISMALVILALVVFGITAIPGFRLELQPEMDMPMLMVVTVYPGADPESVEELVTKEVESAGAEQSGVSTVTSQSAENLSMVMFQYEYGTDLDESYMDLKTALDSAKTTMPDDVQEPIVMELAMDQSATMNLSVTAEGTYDIAGYVDDILVPELETLSGVADVDVSGGRENYIKVELDSDAMRQYGITMESVAQTISAMDFTLPVGSFSHGTQDIAANSSADIDGVVQLKNIPVMTARGRTIALSEIANVSESLTKQDSLSRYNGSDNINIAISKKKTYGTVDVTDEVEERVARLQAENSSVNIEVIYNASDTIRSALSAVASTLVLGVILSMIVLFLFFGDFKASLIVGSSMPISLFATIIVMNLLGFTFNTVTMGALVIAIGMMVDSSIVVLESCFRVKDGKVEFREAALEGTELVTASIIASTITTVVVYLPLSTMEGLAGQMFSQLGVTIIVAMIASLIMAMTIIPLLFSVFQPKEKKDIPINKLLRVVNRGYDRLMRKLLHKKALVVLVSVGLLGMAIALVSSVPTELMTSMDEGVISITASFRSGTKIETIDAQAKFLEDLAKADENVEGYSYQISGDSAVLTLYISDDCELSEKKLIENYSLKLEDTPNMDISIASGGGAAGNMMGGSDVEIDIEGQDLEALKKASRQVQEVVRNVPGVLHVSSDLAEASTQAQIVVDPVKSMAAGYAPMQVALQMYNALSGVEAAEITKDGEEIEVRVEYPEGEFDQAGDFMNMILLTPMGGQIPLSDIARIEYRDAPVTLTRVDGIYQVAITATTTEEAKYSAQEAANAAMESLSLPDGVSRTSSIVDDMLNDEFASIFTAILTSVFLIFLVMAMQFESPRFSLMVMISIPFALVGSFSLMYVSGQALSMVSLMGVLMLVGIVVNNGILYVDTVNRLKEEMELEEALVQSGQLRLRPILMTTLTTILSMVPMALGIGEGSVIMQGMAIVIIGGLVASTVLILMLMPTFYLIIAKKKNRKRLIEAVEKG